MKLQLKVWWGSRTIWLAVLQAVGGIVAAVMLQHPEIAWLSTVKSVVDVLLRLDTDTAIK